MVVPHFYFYTRSDDIKLNKFKIGETIEQEVADRVKQYDKTSHSDKLIWNAGMKFNAEDFIKKSKETSPNKTKNFDKELHSLLVTIFENDIEKAEDSDGTEWFKFNCFEGKNLSDNEKIEEVFNYIQKAINLFLVGVARPNTFSPRPDQQRCIDAVTSHYNSYPDKPFLMNCKMRFGKCFTTYQIAKKMQCKKILIGTYLPSVKESWKEDLNSHVDFAGYSFHEVTDDASIFDNDQNQVFFFSFQGAIANDKKEIDKQTRNWVYEKAWDLFVFDEEHYGKNTEECDSILSRLNLKFKLYLSGTPYKDLMSGIFTNNQIFSWTYEDEQLAKKEWSNGKNPYADLPGLKFYAIEIEKYLIDKSQKYFSIEEGFKLTKLFATNKDSLDLNVVEINDKNVMQVKFKNETLVKRLLNLISEDCNSVELMAEIEENSAHEFTNIVKDIKNCSPWALNDDHITIEKNEIEGLSFSLKHTLWKLPSIAACIALKKLLSDHFSFKNKKIIIAANHIDVEKVKELRQEIKKNISTVTLTVDAFTVGVTVPEWGAVFMFDDGKSVTEYFQTIFRCQTPYKGKNYGYIFDYNPQRLVKMSYEYNLNNRKGTKDFEKRFEMWLQCAPILKLDGKNQWKTLDVCEIMSMDFLSLSDKNRGFLINDFKNISINNSNLEKLNIGFSNELKNIRNKQNHDIKINDHGLEGAKSKEIVRNEKQEKEIEEFINTSLEEKKEKVKAFLANLPKYLFISNSHEESIDDILTHRKNEDLFVKITKLQLHLFELMLKKHILDYEQLNLRIKSFQLLSQKV